MGELLSAVADQWLQSPRRDPAPGPVLAGLFSPWTLMGA
ncbi:hypothetical protein BLL52_2014 [Rhodoferax antarcticus ANT.BR]|uniref:Uncharacterized protein n=1 Tax=Rhodoferax antarcticus ANT.BR TaxID=1111071 RepID=A0A1Q8YCN8_9BURK|nr:hypothetical protein BLL52_2014 [Rhodoferax antarcticus ANT.BR]